MNAAERVPTATPWWFWVFAVLFLLLQLLGLGQLPTQFFASEAERAARLPPAMVEIMRAEPWWATAGYTLALVAGFLGAVCLLTHRTRTLVVVLLATAIVGLLVQRAWFFLLSDLTHLLPPAAHVTLFSMVGVHLIAIWMARRAVRLAPPAQAALRVPGFERSRAP